MNIVEGYPPMYAEIAAAFDLSGRKPIFSWGDKIYNPHRVVLDRALQVHESVHGERQGNSPEAWWRRYMDDPGFRLTEELLAHHAEWKVRCAGLTPNQSYAVLRVMAHRMSSKMYGSLISLHDAKIAIATPHQHFRTRLSA